MFWPVAWCSAAASRSAYLSLGGDPFVENGETIQRDLDALVRRRRTAPPSTGSTTPVIKDACSEASCVIAHATSSGRPIRPSGVWAVCHSRTAAIRSGDNPWCFPIGVSIAPGATATTRTPRGASSTAQLRVRSSRAAFVAA